MTNLLGGVVSSFAETEKQMVSVERAQQYIDDVPHERLEGSLLVSHYCLMPKKNQTLFILYKCNSFFLSLLKFAELSECQTQCSC